jgi:hypothetical protein
MNRTQTKDYKLLRMAELPSVVRSVGGVEGGEVGGCCDHAFIFLRPLLAHLFWYIYPI